MFIWFELLVMKKFVFAFSTVSVCKNDFTVHLTAKLPHSMLYIFTHKNLQYKTQ